MKRVLASVCMLAIPALAFAQGSGVDLSKAKLKNPAGLTEKAPDLYKAKFDTSAGAFVIEVHRAWAPLGADRFYNLVKNGYYDDCRFFRVIPGFMVQTGINGTPATQALWKEARIQDDPVKESNTKGYVSFASAGANTRTTQFFINFGDNSRLDKPGACGGTCAFPPIGKVTTGMDIVEKINAEYREKPNQGQIQSEGNAYLVKDFPKLDYIKKATIEK